VRKFLAYLHNKRGQAIVEMAIIVPILVLLLAAIFDIGRVMHDALTITYAAREGARAAAVGKDDANILARIYAASPSIDPSTMAVDIVPATQAARQPDQQVTVTINHDVTITTPLISAIVPNPFPLTATAVMRVE
jgi:Flp pilus assembly protein TadG